MDTIIAQGCFLAHQFIRPRQLALAIGIVRGSGVLPENTVNGCVMTGVLADTY